MWIDLKHKRGLEPSEKRVALRLRRTRAGLWYVTIQSPAVAGKSMVRMSYASCPDNSNTKASYTEIFDGVTNNARNTFAVPIDVKMTKCKQKKQAYSWIATDTWLVITFCDIHTTMCCMVQFHLKTAPYQYSNTGLFQLRCARSKSAERILAHN